MQGAVLLYKSAQSSGRRQSDGSGPSLPRRLLRQNGRIQARQFHVPVLEDCEQLVRGFSFTAHQLKQSLTKLADGEWCDQVDS